MDLSVWIAKKNSTGRYRVFGENLAEKSISRVILADRAIKIDGKGDCDEKRQGL